MKELSDVELVVIDMMRSGDFRMNITARNPNLSNAQARQLLTPLAEALNEKLEHVKFERYSWWEIRHHGSFSTIEATAYLKDGPWDHDGD